MSPATPTAHRLFALPADPDVEVLLGDPRPLVRRAGIDLARESMRRWRAAPALLTSLIAAHLSADEAGDRAYADVYLGALPYDPRGCAIGPELLGLLMDRGGLTGRQVTQLHRFFGRPGLAQVRTAPLVWRHDGPAATERLLRVLPGYLDDHCCAPYALKTLVAMGASARPVLPALDAIIDRRERLPVHLGDPGAELRADERLLTRTREARELIRSCTGR